MNKDSQHKSTEAQQWPPISFEKHVWQQDGNQDATERIEEDVVKGESKGPFAKAVEGSGDSGSSSLGLNRSTEMEYQAALPLLIAERSVAVPDDLSARISALLVEMARFDVELGQRADNVPTMLLRSESSASSQIDRLTSTAQSVALAELYPKASHAPLRIDRGERGRCRKKRARMSQSQAREQEEGLLHRACQFAGERRAAMRNEGTDADHVRIELV